MGSDLAGHQRVRKTGTPAGCNLRTPLTRQPVLSVERATRECNGNPTAREVPMRCAIYARVSTLDQQPENQLAELRRYVEARGWTAVEYVDRGVSGVKDRRPALDRLVADARRRRFDVIACWRLDRLGRNLRHLVTLGDELQALGVGLVSLGESIDTTTPSGRLLFGILATLAAFERDRLRERTIAGLQRARAQGVRLGRRRTTPTPIAIPGGNVRAAAAIWGVSKSTAARWISRGCVPPTVGQTSETAA